MTTGSGIGLLKPALSVLVVGLLALFALQRTGVVQSYLSQASYNAGFSAPTAESAPAPAATPAPVPPTSASPQPLSTSEAPVAQQPAQVADPFAPGAAAAAPQASAPAAVPAAAASDPLLASAAARVAGKTVSIGCALPAQTRGDMNVNGLAVPGSDHADLNPTICAELHSFAQGLSGDEWACVYADSGFCDQTVNQDVPALQVLAHESFHLRGETDEATTDCYALQNVSTIAQALGASSTQAEALARYYGDPAHYATLRQAPAGYTSPDCRDGGALDLRPHTSAWPG